MWNQINKVCKKEFNSLSQKLHRFFQFKNFTETYHQNYLDVLTACENPKSIGQFMHYNIMYPLRQTNQMGLEYDMLNDGKNIYCFTTSYRLEDDINPGRHNTIFPMVEFEINKGTVGELIEFEKELIRSLGYEGDFTEIDYEHACRMYDVVEIGDYEENLMCQELSPVVFLKYFPEKTDPFFNMARDKKTGLAQKVDVLMLGTNTKGETRGMETIGSAVRSCDIHEMKHFFDTSVNGDFKKTLYDKFGKERVDKEIEEYFSMNMIPRSGGGIGFTRLLNFMRYHNLL